MSVTNLTDILLSEFSFLEARPSCDHVAVNCPVDELHDFMLTLRDSYNFDMLVDATAIDWDQDSPRFSVVYHVLSTKTHDYLRVVSNCLDDENPEAPTVEDIYPAANWHERETYDMFGIHYTNHSNLKRILMWDEYPYHPLRKEFPLAGEATELPAADVAEVTGETVKPAPLMGGPFVSNHGDHTSDVEPRAKDQSWTEADEKPSE